MPVRIDEYEAMLTSGPLWEERLRGIGKLTRAEVIDMGSVSYTHLDVYKRQVRYPVW